MKVAEVSTGTEGEACGGVNTARGLGCANSRIGMRNWDTQTESVAVLNEIEHGLMVAGMS